MLETSEDSFASRSDPAELRGRRVRASGSLERFDGTVYRVTGVLVQRDGTWRWKVYHGSEPGSWALGTRLGVCLRVPSITTPPIPSGSPDQFSAALSPARSGAPKTMRLRVAT